MLNSRFLSYSTTVLETFSRASGRSSPSIFRHSSIFVNEVAKRSVVSTALNENRHFTASSKARGCPSTE